MSTGERDPRAIRRPLTPDTAVESGGLRLTPHQLAHLRTRLMVQPPGPDNMPESMEAITERSRRITGIPPDVLLTLEAIHLLAEQGNIAARWLYEQERIRLGIDRPSYHYRREP